jgi:hypothetical protein
LSGCNSVMGATCSISGTPTSSAGSPYTFSVHATDGTNVADQSYTISITGASAVPGSAISSPTPVSSQGRIQ